MSSPLASGQGCGCLCLTTETIEAMLWDFTNCLAASLLPGTLVLGTVGKQNSTDYILKILFALFNDS